MQVKNNSSISLSLGHEVIDPGEVKEIEDALCYTERAQDLAAAGDLSIPYIEEEFSAPPEPPKEEILAPAVVEVVEEEVPPVVKEEVPDEKEKPKKEKKPKVK